MAHVDVREQPGASLEDIVKTVATCAHVPMEEAIDHVRYFAAGMGYARLDDRVAAPDVAFLTDAAFRTLQYRAQRAC